MYERAQWYLAKYIPDLRRREPRNVGVILQAGPDFLARFKGEAAPGDINEEEVASWAESVQTYRAWVRYWRGSIVDRKQITREDWVVGPADNYFLEFGGERLVGEVPDPAAFLDELFRMLVQ